MNQQAETYRLTVSLSPATVEGLRELAATHGYVSTSGRHAGVGNITGLLTALARGDLVVFRRESIWRKGARVKYDIHDAAGEDLLASGYPTLCARLPNGEVVELVPILEAEMAP